MGPATYISKITDIVFVVEDKLYQYTRFSIKFKLVLLLPMLLWLSLFQFSSWIPHHNRPEIDVDTLPVADEFLLFGYSLLEWPRNSVPDSNGWNRFLLFLDFLAGFAYLIHFVASWIFAFWLYLYHRKRPVYPGEALVEPWTYLWCFGFLNSIAVVTQLSWPTAPPWYIDEYGYQPANYTIGGDPAGLQRVDARLPVPVFGTLYGNSPLVFGSFPSLHAAWPIMITLFLPQNKIYKVLGLCYTAVVWWAAMYLNHHFLIDLIGGGVYVLFSYLFGLSTLETIKSLFRERMFSRTTRFVKTTKREEESTHFIVDCGLDGEGEEEMALVRNRSYNSLNTMNGKM